MDQLSYKDVTKCCICLQSFTDPRQLPCLHTFCAQCLVDLGEKSEKKPGDLVPCPICRREFAIPDGGMEALAKNFFVQSFLDVKKVLGRRNNPCFVCQKKSQKPNDRESIEATHRCLECCEDYCTWCSDVHAIQTATSSHHIIKIEGDVTNEEIRKMFQVRNCPEHPRKSLDYYCAECKKVVCVSCFVENHKSHDCKDVTNIETEIRRTVKTDSIQISSYAGEMSSRKLKLERTKDEFLQVISDRKEAIMRRGQELKDLIEQHKILVLKELSDIKEKRVKEMDERIEEADRFCTIYQSFEAFCNEIESKGSATDVCSNIDEIKRRKIELDADHGAYVGRPCPSVEVAFKVTELETFLETAKNFVGKAEDSVSQIENFLVGIGTVDNAAAAMTQAVFRVNLHRPNEVIDLTPIPVPSYMDAAVATVSGNDLYVVGVGAAKNELYRFNVTTGWTACAPMGQGRSRHCASVSNSALFVFGGFVEADNTVLDAVEAYNTVTNSWESHGKLSHAVQGAVCVVQGRTAYIFGGSDQNNATLDRVQVYDIEQKTCALLEESIPNPVKFVGAALWEKYALLFGHKRCLVLDLEKKSWEGRENFGPEFTDYTVVCANDRIFIVGGLKTEIGEDGAVTKSEYSKSISSVPVKSILYGIDIGWKTHAELRSPFLSKACGALWYKI